MRKIECFKIRILESDLTHLWDISSQKPLKDILCDKFSLSLNPVTIVADPFLFVYGDRLYLFYEMKRNYSPGVICMTSTTDLINWSESETILAENFHLSYPFVFEDNGSVYMIPETSDIGDIRLYKADNERLNHFSLYKTLIFKDVIDTEIGFADSSIYKKDGYYYLVTSIERNHTNILYLYTSDNIEGPYYEHPCSPICSSSKYGRDAGCWLEFPDGILYRVAQDCEVRYGDNVHLLEIQDLSLSGYSEKLIMPRIIPLHNPFYRNGGHQFNFVQFKNRYIVATDAKEYHYYAVCRMIHKSLSSLKRYIHP